MVALVLLPGMDGTGSLFSEFISALGPEVETIVVSYPADQPLDYAELERVARSFLPVDRPFVILGESFSGPIAISIAASHPAGLAGLVLCCSFARNPLPKLGRLRFLLGLFPVKLAPVTLLSTFLLGRFSSERLRSALRKALMPVSDTAFRARARAVISVDVSSLCAQICVPALYLRASEDRVVFPASVEVIGRALKGLRVIEFEAPHLLLQALPSATAKVVREFVCGVAPG